MDQNQDTFFLREAFKLAKKGIGWTNPNPMVGAVIVKRGEIIGSGYHRKVGLPHAEIEAIQSAKESVEGATLYVTLEPCSHFGRTPPCVDEVIKAKITRIVCSTLDPNPLVLGKGIVKLKKAGIDVLTGVLEEEAKKLNEAFLTFHIKKRPFIALKFASSLDGKIATKTSDSKWITNEKARQYARTLRGEYQAILVGIHTIMKDNPHLGVRIKGRKDPLRIIVDPHLKIPPESFVLRDNNVLIITTSKHDKTNLAKLTHRGIQVLILSEEQISIPEMLSELRKREIISVLVEGGGKTLGSFVDARLFDKVYAFHSPILVGGEHAIPAIGGEGVNTIHQAIGLEQISFKRFENNYLITGYKK